MHKVNCKWLVRWPDSLHSGTLLKYFGVPHECHLCTIDYQAMFVHLQPTYLQAYLKISLVSARDTSASVKFEHIPKDTVLMTKPFVASPIL